MIFSSLEFLFFFFPLVFIVYILIKPQYANMWLLLMSIYFYYAGAKEYVGLLFRVIAVAYVSGLLMYKSRNRAVKWVVLCAALAIMLVAMIYFKYWNFIVENINKLGMQRFEVRDIILPIGISFFIFQAVSYIVDVWRGAEALKNPVDMGLYISFFPQLIAGPIVRFQDISEYLKKVHREVNPDELAGGGMAFWNRIV